MGKIWQVSGWNAAVPGFPIEGMQHVRTKILLLKINFRLGSCGLGFEQIHVCFRQKRKGSPEIYTGLTQFPP